MQHIKAEPRRLAVRNPARATCTMPPEIQNRGTLLGTYKIGQYVTHNSKSHTLLPKHTEAMEVAAQFSNGSFTPKLNLASSWLQTGFKLASDWLPTGKIQLGYISIWFHLHCFLESEASLKQVGCNFNFV